MKKRRRGEERKEEQTKQKEKDEKEEKSEKKRKKKTEENNERNTEGNHEIKDNTEGIRIIQNALIIILPIEMAAKFSVADKAHTGINMF